MNRFFLAVLGAALCLAAGKGCAGDAAAPSVKTAPSKPGSGPNAGVLPAAYHGRPLMWIPKRSGPKKLSGDLSDPVWKKARRVEFVDPVKKTAPKYKTEAFVFCTDQALYFGFKCHDPKMDELKTAGGKIWTHDEVELFFEPYENLIQRPYHQIIVNADGQKSAGRLHLYPKYHYNGLRKKWNPDFEVETGKGKDFWTCEIKVPFAEMNLSAEAKAKQTLWRLNLYRSRPRKKGEGEMAWAWSPPGVKYFHSAGKFGYALPESHAMKALIERIKKTALRPKKSKSLFVEAPLEAEIRKRVGELGADSFAERRLAGERLEALFRLRPALREAVRKELQEALARSREVQLLASAQTMLGRIKEEEQWRDEDDPPPKQIRQRWMRQHGRR